LGVLRFDTETQRLRERQTAKPLLCNGNRGSRETENYEIGCLVVLCFSAASVAVAVTKFSPLPFSESLSLPSTSLRASCVEIKNAVSYR
jgi:hypothetical protein